MQKSLILRASMITDGASFGGVLNGSGDDYRTISAKSSVDVGTLAFSNGTLRSLSRACVLNSFSIKFDQKVSLNTGGPELRWEFTPRKITNYSVNGTSITVKSTTDLASKSESKTNGGDWINSRSITLFSGSDNSVCGTDTILGFYLKGVNPAVFKYQLYMRNLSATFTYTARYYARFYNENGALANEQLLEANEYASITEVMELLEKPGYDIKWWEIVEGEGKGEFVDYPRPSVDTDIGFKPYYVPKTYSIEVYPQRTDDLPGLYVEKKVNGAWNRLTPTRTRDYVGQVYAYYSGTYGDVIRFVADGYRSDQNLVISKNQGLPVDVVCNGQPITVDEKTVDGNYYVSIQQVQDVAFPISTSAGTGGTITAPQSVPRHGSADIVVTPGVGYELETVTIDDSTQEVDGTEPLTIPFTDVTAMHSVSATFARIKIPIDLSGLPDGITVQGPNEVDYGSSQTWVFGCDGNHSLLTITVDGYNMMDPVFKQVTSFEVPLNNITESRAFCGTLTGDLVTVAIQQTTGGTVTCDDLPDGSGKFLPNVGALTFRATPDAYYNLVGWYNGAEGRTITVDVTGNLTVSADFDPAQIEIQTTLVCEEDLNFVFEKSVDGAWVPASRYVDYGDTIRIKLAYPDRPPTSRNTVLLWGDWGYETPTFVVVSAPEEGEGTEKTGTGSVTVTIVGETTVEATVKRQLFYMGGICVPQSGGKIVFSVEPNEGGRHNAETELKVSAIPAPGYYFLCWARHSGESYVDEHGGFSIDQSLDFVVPYWKNGTERTYIGIKYAHFRQIDYEVTTTADEGGTVSGGGKFHYGDQTSITIRANYGFKIKDVLLDGVSVYEDVMLTMHGGTYELKDIDASHSVEVQFGPRFFSHDRKLLDYYPPVIKSIHEIQALMAALQVQDAAMFDAASFIFENQFIETATAEGVSRWERELGIIPAPTDTLRQRKERLRIKWVPKPRFTMQWLRKWLETVCGQAVRDPVLTDYSLRVTLPGGVDWMTIFDDLKRYKPASIVLDPRVLMPRGRETLYVGTATMISNHDSPIKYTLDTRGD